MAKKAVIERRKKWAGEKARRAYLLVVEKALGRKIPPGACVHHIDENPRNDDPSNLLLCPSESYHRLVHMRSRALAECGHAGWLRCEYCKKYDNPINLSIHRGRKTARHPECHATYNWNNSHE
jgi:HNH endonuclease